MEIKLIILDFDGVVIDSNSSKQLSVIKFCRNKFNFFLPSKISFHELRELDRYQQCQIAKGSEINEKEKREIDYFIEKDYSNLRLDPFINKLYRLCNLKKIFLSLVSSTPHHSLVNVLNDLSIDHYFDTVYGKSNNLEKSYYFNKLISDFHLNPKNVLSVGDHINDYLCSKQCHIKFHAIRNSSLRNLNYKINHSSGLYELSKKIGLINK